MPKLKSKSGAKKRFFPTAGGKIRTKRAYTSHMMRRKPKGAKRKLRGTGTLCEADTRIVKRSWLPYAR